ncbi:MAG: hypothetical protein U5J95_02745 [Balneolaceae bacterium]|nr:hypothetical protein [Balneolaceae bacterium]
MRIISTQHGPNDFLIRVYDSKGKFRRAIYYPLQRKPLVREEILSITAKDDWNRELLEHAELPETWPVIYTVVPDDKNRLWVSTIVNEDEVFEWWVLSNTGKLIAKFNWPRSKPIEVIKNGYIYTRETEEETELEQIVRYRFEIN